MTRQKAAHGTESGYSTHVREHTPICDDCRDAHRAYTRTYRANRKPQRVAPTRAVEHIARLVALGMPKYLIAERAGIGRDTVNRLARQDYIYAYTERRILAVQWEPGQLVPSIGTARRLQALAVMGWPISHLSMRLGYSHDRAGQWLRQPYIAADNAAEVARLYDELSMQRGPSRRAAMTARSRGWLPPLAWDDDTIDDPAAWADLGGDASDEPDAAAVARLVDGFPFVDWRAIGATRADRLAAYARMDYRERRAELRALGYSDAQIDLPPSDRVRRYLGLRSSDAARPAETVEVAS